MRVTSVRLVRVWWYCRYLILGVTSTVSNDALPQRSRVQCLPSVQERKRRENVKHAKSSPPGLTARLGRVSAERVLAYIISNLSFCRVARVDSLLVLPQDPGASVFFLCFLLLTDKLAWTIVLTVMINRFIASLFYLNFDYLCTWINRPKA